MCSLSYPARKAHALYYIVLCGLSDSTIFVHIISQKAQLKKKVIEYKMCVLNLSTTFVSNIFHSKKSAVRYYHKCRRGFIY